MSGGILGSAEDADVQNEVHSRQMVPPPIHVLSGMEGLTIREPRPPFSNRANLRNGDAGTDAMLLVRKGRMRKYVSLASSTDWSHLTFPPSGEMWGSRCTRLFMSLAATLTRHEGGSV